MGIVSRFERRLQGAVGDGLARVFGGGVVPKEVEAALQRQADDNVAPVGAGHMLAPNSYVIALSPSDYEQLAGDHGLTVRAFAKHLEGYLAERGWQTYGEVRIAFESSPTLHTGQFRTHGSVDPDVGRPPPDPTRRPAARPPANPLSGAGPMTQNPGYDPRREPADADLDRRGRAEYPGEPRGTRGFATPLSGGGRGGYPNAGGPAGDGAYRDHARGGGYPNGYDQAPAEYPNGYEQQGYGAGGYPPGRSGPEYGAERGGYGAPGYGGAPAGYAEQGYADPGYGNQGYPDQGYGGADPGYPEAPAGFDNGGYAPPTGERGYAQPGQSTPPAGYGQQPPQYDQRGPYGAPDGSYGPSAGKFPTGGSGYGAPGGPAAGGYGKAFAATLALDDGSGRTYQLREGSNIIGRGQDAHFRLPDTGVSRRHIEVRWDGQVAMLSDLGSTNGTLVNGSPVQDWQLADGDVIRAGHSEILIRIG